MTRRTARLTLAGMDLADLLDLDRPRRRARRSPFYLRVRAGIDLLELARRGCALVRKRLDARRRRGTSDDPRLGAAQEDRP